MRGLFKRKGSDVWQGRFRIPQALWRERETLRGLGVKDISATQEFARSTDKRDSDEAGAEYRKMLVAWDAKLASWKALLTDGPKALTHRQRIALAAEYGKQFLEVHSDDPGEAPSLPEVTDLGDVDRELEWVGQQMSPDELVALRRDLLAYLKARDPAKRDALNNRLIQTYPAYAAMMRDGAAAPALEQVVGRNTKAALAARSLHVTPETRRLTNYEMLRTMGAVERALEARAAGDYRPVPELENAPVFEAAPMAKVDLRFTFAAIVKAETERRAKGKDAKPFPAATVRRYKKRGAEFAAWRETHGAAHPKDASTVTRLEALGWQSALVASGETTNRTINDKVSSISSIIMWGRRLYPGEFLQAGHPLEGLTKLGFTTLPSDARTYRLDEAVAVLKAARLETEERRRWLPWICAYTGARIEEAGQLHVADVFQVSGKWFLRFTTAGRRSLKTASSERRVPVHPALVREGFIKFVQATKGPRLFASMRIQPHMSEFIREVVGIKRPELSPNHGWRHFFEDLCTLANMPDAARDYITGRATGKSRDMYGRSELMLGGLAKAMAKVPDILNLAGRDTGG